MVGQLLQRFGVRWRAHGDLMPRRRRAIGRAAVVASHDFWQSRVAGDPEIIGKSVTIDGVPHTVVGIAPADFRGHPFLQARVPCCSPWSGTRVCGRTELFETTGLRTGCDPRPTRPGVDIERANTLVSAARLAQRYPASNEFKAATVEPHLRRVWPAGRRADVISVSCSAWRKCLIVCLNISGMMLVRGANRERELSIRAALGAGRRRLIQHLFFEAVLIAFAGGALSAFVLFGIPALVGWHGRAGSRDRSGRGRCRDLVWTVPARERALRLMPAVRFSRPNLIRALKEDAGGGGRHTIRVHRVAAMVQIGIAAPFLVLSGVMLDRVRTAEFGFPTDGLAAARLPAPVGPEREAGFSSGGFATISNRQAAFARLSWPRAPIDFDYRRFRVGRKDGSEFVTAQVTRVGENFLETSARRCFEVGRSRRGPHHGCARRGDFRTARQATLSGHRADWRTGDDHDGRCAGASSARLSLNEESASRSSRLWA